MTTSAFPPATPLLDAVATVRQRLASLTTDDLRRFLDQALVVLAFLGGILIALAKRLHLMLKGAIILLRVSAELLEQLDDWIEYMIVANSARPQASPDKTPAPAPILKATADAEADTPQPRITRRRTKRSATPGFSPVTA